STGLAILIAIVVYQQVENYLLQPKVTAHTMEIHVTVAFGSGIAGGLLLGAVGALLALPAAATVQAFMASYLERQEVVQELEEAEAAQHPERDPMGERIRQVVRRVFTPR
ncbi:MAG: AI-2E family transporter, partial [Acidimicrobiia bacterium]|nr:AI-2E family transporter [Acidimicrobiia bacterium]